MTFGSGKRRSAARRPIGDAISIPRLAHALAFGLVVISVAANIVFGLLLTSGPERFLYAAAFGLLDAFKSVLLILATSSYRGREVGKARVTVALFLVLSVLSFSAEIGLYATTTGSEAGGARAAHATYENAKAKKNDLEERLVRIGSTRPVDQVDADIAAAKLDKAFPRSKECKEATLEASRGLCARLVRLEAERATALRAEDLRRRLDEASDKLDGFDMTEVFKPVDPQAETLAKLAAPVAALSPETVRTVLAVLIALLIEVGSGLGPWLASGHAERRIDELKEARTAAEVAEALEAAAEPEQPPADEIKPERCHIEAWLEDGVTRRKGGHVMAAEMLDSYRGWCAQNSRKPVAQTALGTRLGELGYAKAKVAGKIRYTDLALKPVSAGVKLVASR
jgi:hypothetical protein